MRPLFLEKDTLFPNYFLSGTEFYVRLILYSENFKVSQVSWDKDLSV